MDNEARWLRRIERERKARQEAERLLEEKSLELFQKNKDLEHTLENLEALVEERTGEVKLLSLVASKATCGVVITDPQGKTEWVNDGFVRITGYSMEEMAGKVPGHVLQGPDSNQKTIEMMSAKIKAREAFSAEILNYTKDGVPYWVQLDANPIFHENGDLQSFVSIQTDITERKRAEEAMRLLTAALEQSSEGFALTDANGVFTYLNKAHATIFGYEDASELIGKSWDVLYSSEEVERLKSEVFPILMRRGLWKGIAKATRKEGSTFPEDLTLTLLKNGQIICGCRDDTERVAAEEALRRAIDEAKTLNLELRTTVEELDAYAHTVAHDLRNPVLGITAVSETLRDNWEEMPMEQQREFLDMLYSSATSLEDIIRELLILSSVRKESIKLSSVNPASSLEEVRTRFQYMIKEKSVRIEIDEPLLSILAYAPWIDEVMANTISNAIKYGGEPPLVRVGTERLPDGRVRTYIDDNGSGIPEEKRISLFNEFTRVHSDEIQGHGLGLSIVLRIIHKLGGEVGISDSPIGGARVYFVLPAAT